MHAYNIWAHRCYLSEGRTAMRYGRRRLGTLGERAGGTPVLQGLVFPFLSAGDSFCQNTIRRIERVTCLREIGNSLCVTATKICRREGSQSFSVRGCSLSYGSAARNVPGYESGCTADRDSVSIFHRYFAAGFDRSAGLGCG